MLLATTEPDVEETAAIPSMGKRAWRWKVELTLMAFEVSQQVSYGDGLLKNWTRCNSYFAVSFRPLVWQFGTSSIYYDGMHYSYSFGPIQVSWCM